MIAAEQTEIFRKALPGGRGMVVSERRPRERFELLRLRRQSEAGTCGWNLGIFTVGNGGRCHLFKHCCCSLQSWNTRVKERPAQQP